MIEIFAVLNFADGAWTHENSEIKSTAKMSRYIYMVLAVVSIQGWRFSICDGAASIQGRRPICVIILGECSALWGEREQERYGECHKKSSPAQEESALESTGPAK